MRLFSLLVGVVGVVLTGLQCHAGVEIPAQVRDGLVWVQVSPAGKSAPLHFLLDSGASSSVLDLGVARRLGLKLGSPQSFQGVHSRSTAFRIRDFAAEIGGTKVPADVLAIDLAGVSAKCHRKVDGLLGADFFRGRIVQIDYAAQKVRILSRGESSDAAGTSLPLALKNGSPCVRVSVSGQPARWTRVDTGCNSPLEWVNSSKKAAAQGGSSIGFNVGRTGNIVTDVQLGSERISGVQVGIHSTPIFAGEAGLLGNGLLSRFARVTFDLSGKVLLLSGRNG